MATVQAFLVATVTQCALAKHVFRGELLPTLSGKTCKFGEQLFATKRSSKAQCLLECGAFSGAEQCRGVFYSENDGRCQGCSKFYLTADDLPDSLGKAAGWGELADTSTECAIFRNMRYNFNDGRCRCDAGWPYDNQTKECVIQCDNLGPSFDMESNVYFDDASNTIFAENAAIVDMCLLRCISVASCLSVNYWSAAMLCQYQDRNAAMAQSPLTTYSGRLHFTRNCA